MISYKFYEDKASTMLENIFTCNLVRWDSLTLSRTEAWSDTFPIILHVVKERNSIIVSSEFLSIHTDYREIYRRAIQKVTSNDIIFYHIQNMRTYLSYLSALSPPELSHICWNTFLYACVREFFRLWAQARFNTFHQFLFIIGGLSSQGR